MSSKRKHDDDPTSETASPEVFRSAPIEDRQSTVLGLFSPSLKPKELQALAEIASASHKIVGWRKQSNQQSITKATQYVLGSDDDGEKYAGKKVEKTLDALKVVGACVVARWYGGVLLGPARFTHIEQVAKEAVQAWQQHEAESRQKRRKLEEEQAEHTRLAKSLGERDQSVAVLQDLAAKKERELKEAKEGVDVAPGDEAVSSIETPKPSSTPTTDYSAMPLDRLRALDKARDATLSFLLKRIDKAEAELAEHKGVNSTAEASNLSEPS